MADAKKRSADPAAQKMIACACEAGVDISWDRLEAQEPQCGFGKMGICCRHCTMGPCRIDPFDEGAKLGVCGADADTIVARGLLREICAGVAAHSDHGREIIHALKLAAEGKSDAYKIKGPRKLRKLADEFGIEQEGRSDSEVAKDLAAFYSNEFGKQDGALAYFARAPEQQRKNWEAAGAVTRGIDREVVTSMHMTNVGVDSEAEHIIMACVRTSLADGWGGAMIATDVSDILFGEPKPVQAAVNLGVIKEDEVNVIVHGHEPVLSDVIVAAARDPELIKEAEAAGAKGINLAGICCTANEILMRHGIPVAGNYLHQELAIMTGAVDVMLVDVQCVWPSLADLSKSFHTKVVSTSSKAKFKGATHIEFEPENAMETAKKILRVAIENYANRDPSKVNIPSDQEKLVAGFTTEVIFEMLGGRYRPSFRPLNDGIMTGRIRGVAGVVGCNNPKFTQDKNHIAMVKELIANDVLVVQTGCSAIACAKAGLLSPEAAEKHAGKGLQEICRAVGIPPVLHMGSCVDNSRILTACAEMVKEGGIGDSYDKLPVAGAAPEWMAEKAMAIGMYVVASGIYTVVSPALPVEGSKFVEELLTKTFEKHFGATWAFEDDPVKGARLMIDRIDLKRAELGLSPLMYEVPYAPKAAEAAEAAAAGS
jgi:carbon-monoxide dehydrogenase catalytic subunit